MPLDNAPDHIKLAVDLIQLMERNGIDNHTAEQALLVVLEDVRYKIAQQEKNSSAQS